MCMFRLYVFFPVVEKHCLAVMKSPNRKGVRGYFLKARRRDRMPLRFKCAGLSESR